MVHHSDIKLNNESLASSGSGPVAVFVGGTAGIGHEAFLALLRHTTSPTVYLVGRGQARLEAQLASAQKLNAGAKLIPIVADDLTLVRDSQKAAKQIATLVNQGPGHIDLLVLSQGFFSFATKPDWSAEGLDKITAIRYHSRLAFVATLLPALRKAANARVVSVLAGGQEADLKLDDLGFTQPGTYGPIYAANASASYTTLAFEHLARAPGNDRLVFVHLFPGFVATGLTAHGGPWPLRFLFNYASRPFMWLFARTPRDAGERVLFAATNGRFRRLPSMGEAGVAEGTLLQEGSDGKKGSGVYLVQGNSTVVSHNAALDRLREKGAAEKVWEYTLAEFDRISKL